MNEQVVANKANALLLFATFIIAICGLVYELLAGTISSYLLGDSVFQFSLVIGVFLAAMGVGAWLSRFVENQLVEAFILVQCGIAITGGFSAALLFFAFSHINNYQSLLFLLCLVVGTLVGFEIPVVIRILKAYRVLRLNVSNVLSADYIGALIASLLFPLVLVPQLGLLRTSFLFGLLNCFVAGLGFYVFYTSLSRPKYLLASIASASLLLVTGLAFSTNLTGFFQSRLYSGEIIHNITTPYQNIVITRDGPSISLFINGHLQFNSLDEYRYHEALVHPAMALSRLKRNVLVLGGGDGMAVREILRYPQVESIVLVDLDKTITDFFRNNQVLSQLNMGALQDRRVKIVNLDAWKFIDNDRQFYDVIIVDLPDPHSLAISKLYSREFYAMLAQHLGAEGILITQATSPLFAREAFWCIHDTIQETASPISRDDVLHTLPYHIYVPSFGEWGFVMASARNLDWASLQLPANLQYLNNATLQAMLVFPPDMATTETNINSIATHSLVKYYESGWNKWYSRQ